MANNNSHPSIFTDDSENSNQHTSNEVRAQPFLRKKPDFFSRPPEEQAILRAKRDLSWRLRTKRKQPGRTVFSEQDWKEVETILQVKRRGLFKILSEHERYEEEYCRGVEDFDAASAAYFINNPGRPTGGVLQELEQKAVFLALIDRYRDTVFSGGERIPKVPLPNEVDRHDVYLYARTIQPTLTPKKARNEIDRLLNGDKAALVLYAVYGERWAREHLAPKKDSTPLEIDWYWLIDDLHPKVYINHLGRAVKMVILWGLESISEYVLGMRAIPKTEINTDGSAKKVSYTKEDFSMLVATAMTRFNRRPRYLYNDSASAFTSIIQILPALTESGDELIEMKNSFPGRPWARKIENHHGQLRKFMEQCPGAYWDRESELRAQSNPDALWTAERWTQELEAYRCEINTERRADKQRKDKVRPTREEVWTGIMPRPSPSIRRLVSLPLPISPLQKTVAVYHFGFHFDNDVYVPICEEQDERKQLYRLWMNAAAQTKEGNSEFSICAVKLDIVGWQVEIMLADGLWFRAVPKKQQNIDIAEHEQAKNAAFREMRAEVVRQITVISEEVIQAAGGLPERVNIKRDYRIAKPSETNPAAQEQGTKSDLSRKATQKKKALRELA